MSEPVRLDPGRYGGWRATPLGARTERLELDLVFELAGPLAGKAVLDVGTGDGSYALAAAEHGARVTGVDADPAMLRAAEQRAAARGLTLSSGSSPPRASAARLFAPVDRWLSLARAPGAAFLVVAADKPATQGATKYSSSRA